MKQTIIGTFTCVAIVTGWMLGSSSAQATPSSSCFCEADNHCVGLPLPKCLSCWEQWCGRLAGCNTACTIFNCGFPNC